MRPETSTYKLTISYNGQAYYGWQRLSGKPTLQGALEEAVKSAYALHVPVQGSGRTDRGAHATGQVATVQLPAGLDAHKAMASLNALLPEDIRILECLGVSEDFHACDSAIGKTYRYVIWNSHDCPAERQGRVWHLASPLDIEAMRAACPLFEGKLDFASFAKKPNFERASTVRDLQEVRLQAELPLIEITLRADGFLYKMVRNIVRAIVKVGEGRTSLAELEQIIAARDRHAAPGTAPASGLFLDTVYYNEDA